ncbi:unnamed protein product, partial [Prunus brigantina]
GIEEENEGRSKAEGSRSEYSPVRLFAQTTAAERHRNKSQDDGSAYASISVFTNLVDAVEISWIVASGSCHLLTESRPVSDQLGLGV